MKDQKKYLITSVGTATAVNLIRYFQDAGVTVIGTDINEYGYTAGSMLADSFHRVPFARDAEYLSALNQIISSEHADVLIPVNDIEVEVVSEHIDEIPIACLVPEPDTIRRLKDKFICSSEVSKIGIPVPAILDIDDIGQKRILRDRIGVGSKGIRILEEGEPAPAYGPDTKFLQEFMEGDEFTVDVLADMQGNPVYIVPRHRLEVKSGVATKVRVMEDDQLIRYCRRLLDHFKLPGFSNIQFIRSGENSYWFVEINYRFSGCGSATLAVAPDYLGSFMRIMDGENAGQPLNHDVRWNTVVTRYYKEVVYEESNT